MDKKERGKKELRKNLVFRIKFGNGTIETCSSNT